jgi:UDP-3-O-[3-hydroxymyristoyl] glucosamine N-acyltransferase
VIVGRERPDAGVPLLMTDDPYFAFMRVLELLYGPRRHKAVGISPRAAIAGTARIGADCHIHDFVTIADNARIGRRCVIYPCAYIGEGVQLGDDSVIYPNVVIYEGSRIGSRVIINANSAIGADGFGYATHEGVHYKIPQVGGVVIEDDVEVGSSCSIERGTLGDTAIGQGSKLGDLVTIGHGTRVGPYCLLVAQAGIAGSATLGHHCTIGGQAGVVGHITVGNRVTIGGRAGVVNNIQDDQTVLGAPAIDASQARRAYSLIPHLPKMRQDIRTLLSQLQKITALMKNPPDEPVEPQDTE